MEAKTSNFLFVFMGLLLMMLSGCATKGKPYEAGLSAHSLGDEKVAFSEFRKTADAGNPESQWFLSRAYQEGRGVEKNEAEAVKYALMAAKQGFAPAQFDMGHRYYTGRNLGKNYAKAIDWFQKSGAQNFPAALFFLGISYAKGTGVKKDAAQATKYFRLAKEKGFPVSKELLAPEGAAMAKSAPGS